VRGKRAKK